MHVKEVRRLTQSSSDQHFKNVAASHSNIKYAQSLDEKMNYQKVQLLDLITVICIIASNFVFVLQVTGF